VGKGGFIHQKLVKGSGKKVREDYDVASFATLFRNVGQKQNGIGEGRKARIAEKTNLWGSAEVLLCGEGGNVLVLVANRKNNTGRGKENSAGGRNPAVHRNPCRVYHCALNRL